MLPPVKKFASTYTTNLAAHRTQTGTVARTGAWCRPTAPSRSDRRASQEVHLLGLWREPFTSHTHRLPLLPGVGWSRL